MIRFCLKDKTPREEDVYTIDWTPHLGAAVIVGANPVINVLTGTIVVDQGTNNIAENKTSFYVRGGILGEVCDFRVGVNTDGVQKLDAICTIGIRGSSN